MVKTQVFLYIQAPDPGGRPTALAVDLQPSVPALSSVIAPHSAPENAEFRGAPHTN